MNNDDDKNDDTGWLRGVSLRLGAGGRARRSGDHIVAPQTGEMGLFAGTPLSLMLQALESAGVDWKPTYEAIENLSKEEQKLLEDKAVKPIAFNIPAPEGFAEAEHTVFCSSLAGSVREERRHKWDRRLAIGGVIVGAIGAAAALID